MNQPEKQLKHGPPTSEVHALLTELLGMLLSLSITVKGLSLALMLDGKISQPKIFLEDEKNTSCHHVIESTGYS